MVQHSRRNISKPVIGVTGNARLFSPSWFCIKLAVFLAGGHALRISVRHPVPEEHLDGLVISGGDDIHPSLYEEEIMAKAHYDEARDELEQRYIEYALTNHLPILGICRGYQLLNVQSGGSLYQDIRPLREKTDNRATFLPRKKVVLKKETEIYKIIGHELFKVNSLHHQAINILASDFQVAAWDADHFIQAIEHKGVKPVIGVQWHPEYLLYLKHQRQLFTWLVAQAKRTVT